MKGAIDELNIYKDNLSSKEINRLYRRMIQNQGSYQDRSTPPPQKRDPNKIDPRMDQIFGDYKDASNQLTLNKNYFSLMISDPLEYPDYNKAIITGSYTIEAGSLLLIPQEIILYERNTGEEKRIKYEGRAITGDIYDDIIIDVYALEMPFKFRKTNLKFNNRKAKKKGLKRI